MILGKRSGTIARNGCKRSRTALQPIQEIGEPALADVGLPERDVPLALFGFNAGIELAQLALVLVACLVAQVNNRLRSFDWDRARPWAGHAIGAVAAMWCIERLFAL